ncbi:MAG: NTP transferase domain-containing protein [Pyrinomonadaceae bacterium]
MTESSVPKIAGLLLAAGGSTRLGGPKQLVEFEGKSLIRRAAEALIGAGCSPVVAVLGAEIAGSQRELAGLDIEIIINDSWESGMGTSIACGMRSVLAFEPVADAVLVSLCDQALVTAERLRPFIENFAGSGADVIAAHYNDVAGVPALFSARAFPELAALTGEKGARELIRSTADAITIPLPEAAVDVDTAADLNRLT